MAKVLDNIVMQGLSGKLGDQLVIKAGRGGKTIVSAMPSFNDRRKFSPAQLAQQQAFREATAYAREKKAEEVYVNKANGGAKSPYNIAVADWFNRPEVLEIDLSGWVNGDGGTIRVRAQDNISVQGVKVTIADETGAFLEESEAVADSALWWDYNTAQAAANNMRVTVAARDLPGHVTERMEVKGHLMMP